MRHRPSLSCPLHQALAAAIVLGAVYAPPVHGAESALQAETWMSSCSQDNVVHARPRLCNHSGLASRFQLTFSGAPAGSYPSGVCDIAGPTAFSLREAQGVLVPAHSCIDLELDVTRPAGMTAGQTACYSIEAQDLTSDETYESHTAIFHGGDLCAVPDSGASAGIPAGHQVPMSFTVYNRSGSERTFRYQLVPYSEGNDPSTLSLNDNPDGSAVTGQLVLPPGAQAHIGVAVGIGENLPGVRQQVLLIDRDTDEVIAARSYHSFTAPAPCVADDATLCLNDGRFEVRTMWRDFEGQLGVGKTGMLTDDTGYFWFFNPNNIEVVLKVLDGRHINDFYWIFFGALSSVEYSVTVRDTLTGESRSYYNPSGVLASEGDINGLPGYEPVPMEVSEALLNGWGREMAVARSLAAPPAAAATAVEPAPVPAGNCVASSTVLCVQGGRFQVEASWSTITGTGNGQATALTSETGYFWFFSPNNVELVVKVLDGNGINGYWWVFFGALSDVHYVVKVTDTVTGVSREYTNRQGQLASVGDIEAFE